MTEKEFDLRGKDFFSELEAAHYCCVSLSQFRKNFGKYNIAPSTFMGKRIYRRDDLKRAMENQWQS